MQHRPGEETEPVTSTVDHADIRGLGTTLLVSVGCLPRSRHEGLSQPLNANEGCTMTGAASLSRVGVTHSSWFWLGTGRTVSVLCYAWPSCVLVMAQTKPASSRAMAAATAVGCLPRPSSLR